MSKPKYNTIRELQIENDKLTSQIEALILSLTNNNQISNNQTHNLEKKLKEFETKKVSANFSYDDFEVIGHNKQKDIDVQKTISDQYSLIFYLMSKIQNTKQQPLQYKCNSFNISDITELFSTQGWIYEEQIKNISKPQKVVSFIGDIHSGKTHIINKIFNLNLPEKPNQSLNIIQTNNDDSLVIIDTPGLNNICQSLKLPLQKLKEIKQINYIIQSIAIHNASIVFYVTNSFTYKTQKEIENIQSMFTSSQNNSMRDLFVLINCPFIYTEQQYTAFVENSFDKDIFQEKGNLFFQVNKPIERKASHLCLTIYAVFCPYLINEILSKMNSFINLSSSINIKNIADEIILKPLKTSAVKLFNLNEGNVKCETVSTNKKAIKFIQNKQQITHYYKQKQITKAVAVKKSNYLGDLSYWKYFEPDTITYSYYVKDDKFLYIQIKCQNVNSISITYKGVKQYEHLFIFNLQSTIKNKEFNESQISYSNRRNKKFVLELKIPSTWGDINAKQKCTQLKYKKGIFLIEYPIQQVDNSLSD